MAGAHLRLGAPADEIVALATELGAGLVTLGSRGLGPVRRLVMGSVSEGVVHWAPCPVLVLRGGAAAWPPARVVVGDDGSADAERAAGLAATIGRLFGACGVLVRACPELRQLPGRDPLEAAELRDEALCQCEIVLTRRAASLADTLGQRPQVRVATDDPAALLLSVAEERAEPALIAVGSRGLGAWQRLRLGSTSIKVLRAAHCPVLVCPRRPGEAAPSAGSG